MEGKVIMGNNYNWLSPVPKQSLSKMVVNKIKDAIIRGDLKPGDFLPAESELAESLGVGKSSVREAVKMLEAIGVVEIIKGNGSKIKDSVSEDIMNPLVFQLILQSNESQSKLLEFREMIETSASVLAIKNASNEDIERLVQNVQEMTESVSLGKPNVNLDMDFHRKLFESTHNPFVVCVGNAVMELYKPSLNIANNEYALEVINDHKATLEALIERDEEKMRKVIKEYLHRWSQRTLSDNMNKKKAIEK